MLVLKFKAYGKLNQFTAIDQGIRTIQFISNKLSVTNRSGFGRIAKFRVWVEYFGKFTKFEVAYECPMGMLIVRLKVYASLQTQFFSHDRCPDRRLRICLNGILFGPCISSRIL